MTSDLSRGVEGDVQTAVIRRDGALCCSAVPQPFPYARPGKELMGHHTYRLGGVGFGITSVVFKVGAPHAVTMGTQMVDNEAHNPCASTTAA